MRSVTEEIKEKLGVVEVLKQYLEVTPAGKNFKAKCPFHNDGSPSLMISPERQSWHCFGCNVGGDIFTFITKYENVEFFEALKTLAEKAGVELKRVSPAEHRQFGVLYDINEEAKLFFQKQLQAQPVVQEYLKERGITPETTNEFELGAAPQSWDELLVHLINKGFEPLDIVRAGLVIKNEQRGSYFDRFRNRLMFPIMNHSGKTVGFTGRVLPAFEQNEVMGKYVNSPETPIFSKSRILYGFHKTKQPIREARTALVVEGQMDFLSAWQDGVLNVVASSGTALTHEQVAAIKRLADEVVLNFDNDEAGRLAGERGIELGLAADLGVKVLVLEDFKDTAELTQAMKGKLKELYAQAKPAMEFYFDRYLGTGELREAEALKRAARKILTRLKVLPSAVERGVWLKRLSRRTGVAEASLEEEMAKLDMEKTMEAKPIEVAVARPASDVFTRVELLSQRALSAAIYEGKIETMQEHLILMPKVFENIFNWIQLKGEADLNLEEKRLAELIQLRSGLEDSESLEELLKQLKIEHLKKRKNSFLERIREMERNPGEADKVETIMQELNKVSAELNEILR